MGPQVVPTDCLAPSSWHLRLQLPGPNDNIGAHLFSAACSSQAGAAAVAEVC